jgi:hypothetical protein
LLSPGSHDFQRLVYLDQLRRALEELTDVLVSARSHLDFSHDLRQQHSLRISYLAEEFELKAARYL